MGMKNALEIYFKKQREYWQAKYSTFPQMPYNKAIDECMIIPNSLKDGYIQWQPIPQDKTVDFSGLERKLNLSIHPRIKEYFTSFWFLSVVGNVGGKILEFTTVPYGINIPEQVENCYKFGVGKFPNDDVHFELGSALIDDDDSYLIYVDNENAQIKCLQPEDNAVITIGSLEETITVMKVSM